MLTVISISRTLILFHKNWIKLTCLIIRLSFVFSVSVHRISNRYTTFTFIERLNLILIFLTFLLFRVIIISSVPFLTTNKHSKIVSIIVIFLVWGLILAFRVRNLIRFFIFFEVRLLPTLILVLGWGYQPERLQAGIFLLIYTIFGSLPLLIGIISIKSDLGSINIKIIDIKIFSPNSFNFWYIVILFAFIIKLPVYGVHLWLPKAHVEAPTAGSIILAGILLKLGGYGVILIINNIYHYIFIINWVLVIYSLYGGVLVRILCIRQVDIKMLIAYSSVAHISLVFLGLICKTKISFIGALILILSHGFASSGLFFVARIFYLSSNSRRIYLNKGLVRVYPSLTLGWFLLCIANIAAPPTLNLVSEILLIISAINWIKPRLILISIITFIGGTYRWYLFAQTQHGELNRNQFSYDRISISNIIIIIYHLLPLFLILLKVNRTVPFI